MSVRFGTSDAIGYAWLRFKEQPGPLIGLLFTMAVIVLVPMIFYVVLLAMDYGFVAFLFYIIAVIAGIFISLGALSIGLKVADKQPWEFGELFAHANRFFPYLGAAILYGLITVGGFFLFILPGIYWSTRFSMYAYFVVDKGQGPVEALKSSWALTEGSFWDLVGFNAAYILLVYVSMIPLGLGLLITLPMQGIVHAYVFRQLEKHPFVPVV